MLIVRLVITFLVPFVLCHGVKAQYCHSNLFVDLTDQLFFEEVKTENSKWVHSNTDNIGTILVDGYLKGLLKGYRFTDSAEVLKWRPLTADLIPQPWQQGKDYYAGDRVSFKGNFYEALSDSRQVQPNRSDDWLKIDLLKFRQPLNTSYFLPRLRDTLSKTEFFRRMIQQVSQVYQPWDSKEKYFFGDKVSYLGMNYEATRDNQGRQPNASFDCWVSHDFEELIHYFNTLELNQLVFFESCDATKSDTIYYPQMVTLGKADPDIRFRSIVHFYYDDLINYLNDIKLPAVYRSDLGYIGKAAFVIGDDNAANLLQWLRKEIIAGDLKIKKEMVLDPILLKKWLGDTTRKDLSRVVYEDLKNKYLVINQVETAINTHYQEKSFLMIPVDMLEPGLIKHVPVIKTYSQAIRENLFKGFRINLGRDSIPVKASQLKSEEKVNSKYFILQRYTIKYDTLSHALKELLPEVWRRIIEAFKRREMMLTTDKQTFFPAQYEWSKIQRSVLGLKNDFQLSNDFTIGPETTSVQDAIEIGKEFKLLHVIYKKPFTKEAGFSKSFIPEKITFDIHDNERDHVGQYTFRWIDIKRLLTKESTTRYQSFIDSVEKGLLNFHRSRLMYGLMEEN